MRETRHDPLNLDHEELEVLLESVWCARVDGHHVPHPAERTFVGGE